MANVLSAYTAARAIASTVPADATTTISSSPTNAIHLQTMLFVAPAGLVVDMVYS